MKHIFAMVLALCMVLCTLSPVMAAAASSDGISIGLSGLSNEEADTDTADDNMEPSPAEPGEEADAGLPPEEAATPEPENEGEAEPSAVAVDTILYSEFVEDDNEYFIRIRLVAADREGNPVEGAVYGLYTYPGWEFVQELYTWYDGTATSEDISVDTDYILLEEVTPENFLPNEGRQEIYLTDLCAPSRLDVRVEYDPIIEKDGYLQINNTDDIENPLGGVVFGLYRAWDNLELAELETAADGTVQYGPLTPGDYYLIEQTVVAGHEMVSGQIPFPIDGSGETVTLNIESPRITGGVQVLKADGGETPLAGAAFGIFHAGGGGLLHELVTGENGTTESPPLYYGDYELRELSGVEGFEIGVPIPFSILEQGVVVEIPVDNPLLLGGVSVMNGDGEDMAVSGGSANAVNDAGLSGAVFGLYSAGDGATEGEITTGSDGSGSLSPAPSDYSLLERASPTEFQLSRDNLSFSLSAEETRELTLSNWAVSDYSDDVAGDGNLLIIKTAEGTGDYLEGAVFGVYRTSNDEKMDEVETDADGRAWVMLEQGDYYLRELHAPSGFLIEQMRIPFHIEDNDRVVLVSVTNEREDGGEVITIPQTGEAFPYWNYTMAALCLTVACWMGVLLLREQAKRRGA